MKCCPCGTKPTVDKFVNTDIPETTHELVAWCKGCGTFNAWADDESTLTDVWNDKVEQLWRDIDNGRM